MERDLQIRGKRDRSRADESRGGELGTVEGRELKQRCKENEMGDPKSKN